MTYISGYIHNIHDGDTPNHFQEHLGGNSAPKGIFERVGITKLNQYWHEDKQFIIIKYSQDCESVLIFREREKNKETQEITQE